MCVYFEELHFKKQRLCLFDTVELKVFNSFCYDAYTVASDYGL